MSQSQFFQFHFITVYPPACLNRDDLNRPKTAMLGGTQRLRVSSQCLKRAWRTSKVVTDALGDEPFDSKGDAKFQNGDACYGEQHQGRRTVRLGEYVRDLLVKNKADEAFAVAVAHEVMDFFLPKKKKKEDDAEDDEGEPLEEQVQEADEAKGKGLKTKETVHLSPAEFRALREFAAEVAPRPWPWDDNHKEIRTSVTVDDFKSVTEDILTRAGLSGEQQAMMLACVLEAFGAQAKSGKKKGKGRGKQADAGVTPEQQTNTTVDASPVEYDAVQDLAKRVALGEVVMTDDKNGTSKEFIDVLKQIRNTVKKAADKRSAARDERLAKLRTAGHGAVDIALFGRMLAKAPEANVDAASQVAHAISVHRVTIEDDFFTTVDDLNHRKDDLGAGMMGNSEFASSVLYHYVCINWTQFLANLDGDEALAKKAVRALSEAFVTVSPSGKRNSSGSHALASFMLVEKGTQQPRSLVAAFVKDVRDDDVLSRAIERLHATRANIDKVYGKCWDAEKSFNAVTGEGSLKDVLDFVATAEG